MALVIDTLDLLHSGIYDAFVIVASDSDYTPLAIKLHESGVYVMGVGEKKTPEPFRNACDEFVYLENLSKDPDTPEHQPAPVSSRKTRNSRRSQESAEERRKAKELKEIHKLLHIAWDKYQDDDRYVNVSSAGSISSVQSRISMPAPTVSSNCRI